MGNLDIQELKKFKKRTFKKVIHKRGMSLASAQNEKKEIIGQINGILNFIRMAPHFRETASGASSQPWQTREPILFRLHKCLSTTPVSNNSQKLWYIYTVEYYSAVKKNSFESVLMRWMKLEPIIQSEVSQKDKEHYSILTHIYGI